MKLFVLVTLQILFFKSSWAGIEIPRDACDWLSASRYGIDIKCDGNNTTKIVLSSILFQERV
jgi:hypothetical protein